MSDVRIPNCFVCMDKGFVFYRKNVDGISYEYATYCICEAGLKYKYNGRNCEKPSDYYVPCISEILNPTELARQNFNEWYRIAKKKNPGILKILKERMQGRTIKQHEISSESETQPAVMQPAMQLPDNQTNLELEEDSRDSQPELVEETGTDKIDEPAEEIEIEIC